MKKENGKWQPNNGLLPNKPDDLPVHVEVLYRDSLGEIKKVTFLDSNTYKDKTVYLHMKLNEDGDCIEKKIKTTSFPFIRHPVERVDNCSATCLNSQLKKPFKNVPWDSIVTIFYKRWGAKDVYWEDPETGKILYMYVDAAGEEIPKGEYIPNAEKVEKKELPTTRIGSFKKLYDNSSVVDDKKFWKKAAEGINRVLRTTYKLPEFSYEEDVGFTKKDLHHHIFKVMFEEQGDESIDLDEMTNNISAVTQAVDSFYDHLKQKFQVESALPKGSTFIDLNNSAVNLLYGIGDGLIAKIPLERFSVDDYLKAYYPTTEPIEDRIKERLESVKQARMRLKKRALASNYEDALKHNQSFLKAIKAFQPDVNWAPYLQNVTRAVAEAIVESKDSYPEDVFDDTIELPKDVAEKVKKAAEKVRERDILPMDERLAWDVFGMSKDGREITLERVLSCWASARDCLGTIRDPKKRKEREEDLDRALKTLTDFFNGIFAHNRHFYAENVD